jgi:hypothetical protein
MARTLGVYYGAFSTGIVAGGAAAPGRRRQARLAGLLRTPGLVPILASNFAYLWMVATVFNTLVPLFATDVLGRSTVGVGVVFAFALAAVPCLAAIALVARTPETLRPRRAG